MLQITLDTKESNKSQKDKKNKNWGLKIKVVKDSDTSEMILSFEEEISFRQGDGKKSSQTFENGLEQVS
ncbi:MAG: hypothetical protein ACOYU5_11930 [Stygiobacter sp.]